MVVYPSLHSMGHLEIILLQALVGMRHKVLCPVGCVVVLSLDGMLVHGRVTPSIKSPGTHLHAWVERGTVRVKCLSQEHSAMSPGRVEH